MSFINEMVQAVKSTQGDDACCFIEEYEKNITGVQLPHLSLQQLFGSTICPFKIIEFAGPPGSCKSTFAFYMAKVFLTRGYNTALIETEHKLSPTLLKSVIGDGDLYKNLILLKDRTIQENWQSDMTMLLKTYKKAFDASKSQGKSKHPPTEKPLLIILDSLGGPLSQNSYDNIKKMGFADRQFPEEALKNARFFASLPESISGYPITILYTNHETKTIDSSGFGEHRQSKGGQTPAFFASYRFFFENTTGVTKESDNWQSQKLTIKCWKNALNQKGGILPLTMRWRKTITEDSDEKQETEFMFGESLANFLAPQQSGFKYDRNAVKQFLTVTNTSKTKFTCKELNLKDEVPQKIGEAIENNQEISTKLRPYLGIKKWADYEVHEEPVKKERKEAKKDDDPISL